MRLAPLTRQTRLFARRTVNLGSGMRLLPGQELITTPKGPGALSWRRITQLYEQRRVVSEADPYFEEIMRGPGKKNNPEYATAWLGAEEKTAKAAKKNTKTQKTNKKTAKSAASADDLLE